MIADDGEGLEAALEAEPDALYDAVLVNAATAAGAPVQIQASSFASAACDSDGRIVAADERFGQWLGIDPLAQVVRLLNGGAPRLTVVLDDRSGRPVAVAAGRRSLTGNWPLTPQIAKLLDTEQGLFAVIAFRPDADAWQRAARAFGLTGQEVQLARALSTTGNLRDAAGTLGIAYETARKLLAGAMAKTGSPRQPDMVRVVLGVVAGDVVAAGTLERVFADLFGLTVRQAGIVRRLAAGETRDSAALAVRISPHVAKDELRVVFEACGVGTVTDLARLFAEVEALAGLATACDVELDGFGGEPLRLVKRSAAPGRVAVCDHGPADGVPVLVFHAMMTGRHLPAVLVSAMQRRGLRPIAFDRAGFGLTDWIDGDVVARAVADSRDLLGELGIERTLILARGGIAAALTLARDWPGLVRGGVIAGPETPAPLDRRRTGLMGRGKRLFYDHPRFAEPVTRIMVGRVRAATLERLIAQSAAGSPADQRAFADPQRRADHIRAVRQATMGVRGFAHEVAAHGRGLEPPRLADGGHWSVMMGATDQIYDQAAAELYWSDRLPGATFHRIADGGRWLHMSHPDAIADALAVSAAD